jgi:O-acetyl-ADP-ribose deacetylase (regulator of RNase III)
VEKCGLKTGSSLFVRVGDISLLNADAIVNSTNESMLERNPVSDRIYCQAGQGLLEEIKQEIKGTIYIFFLLLKDEPLSSIMT